MIKHRDQFKKFVREEEIDPQKFEQAMTHIVDVVVRRHFSWHRDESELRSMARERVIEILNDELDPDDSGYISYIYTGIRNRLTNEIRSDDKSYSRTESGNAEDHTDVYDARVPEFVDTADALAKYLQKAERFVLSERMKKHLAGMFLFQSYLVGDV